MGAYKLAVAASFFILSGGMMYAFRTRRLFPGISLAVLLAAVVLVGTAVFVRARHSVNSGQQTRSLVWYLLPVVVLSVAYRGFVFWFPGSMVGVDPPKYATLIAGVVQAGNIYSFDVFFYSQAPLGIAFPGMLGLAAGGNGQLAMGVYPLLMGVLTPLAVAAVTHRIASSGGETKAILAGGLAAVAAASVNFAYWPVAQSLGIVYWTVLLVFVVQFIRTGSNRLLLLVVLTLFAQVFTHKLPLLVILVVFLVFAVVSRLASATDLTDKDYAITTNEFLIAGIVGALLLIQWAFVTEMLQAVIIRSQQLLATESVSVSPPLVAEPPSAAVAPEPGILGIFLRQGYWFVLLAFGGLAWPLIAYRRFGSRAVRFVLVCTAVPVVLLAISVAGVGGPPPIRTTSFVEPVAIPLVALAFGGVLTRATGARDWLPRRVDRRLPSLVTVLVGAFLVVLVTAQVFSPVAVPDFPGTSRSYTTAEEVNAKSFGYEYVDGPIRSDWFLDVSKAPECVSFGGTAPCRGELRDDAGNTIYHPIGLPLLNANVSAQGYDHVLFRTEVVYYRTSRGEWRLTWNPERSLDGTYNRVYGNGGAVFYERPGTNQSSVPTNATT